MFTKGTQGSYFKKQIFKKTFLFFLLHVNKKIAFLNALIFKKRTTKMCDSCSNKPAVKIYIILLMDKNQEYFLNRKHMSKMSFCFTFLLKYKLQKSDYKVNINNLINIFHHNMI